MDVLQEENFIKKISELNIAITKHLRPNDDGSAKLVQIFREVIQKYDESDPEGREKILDSYEGLLSTLVDGPDKVTYVRK